MNQMQLNRSQVRSSSVLSPIDQKSDQNLVITFFHQNPARQRLTGVQSTKSSFMHLSLLGVERAHA